MARVVKSILGPDPAVDDVVQDTVVKVFLHREEIGRLRDEEAWARTLARRAAFDYCKRTRRIRAHEIPAELDVPGATPPADDVVGFRRELALLQNALAALDAADRELLELVLDTDATHARAVTGRPSASVRRKVSEIRRKLSKLLGRGRTR